MVLESVPDLKTMVVRGRVDVKCLVVRGRFPEFPPPARQKSRISTALKSCTMIETLPEQIDDVTLYPVTAYDVDD
jgi:hypothetical protein